MADMVITVLFALLFAVAVVFRLYIQKKDPAGLNQKQKRILIRIQIASATVCMIGLVPDQAFDAVDGFTFASCGDWLKLLCYLTAYAVIGLDCLKKAVKGILRGGVPDESFLMTVATVGAFALAVYAKGDCSEAVAVMLFYRLGELLEGYAVGKSRRSIGALMDIRPDYAHVEIAGGVETMPPEQVSLGSTVVVFPGEKIPLDGVVTEGSSSLNMSALTGESLPRDVCVGDEVMSGCINTSGLLKVYTTKEFGESTVARILALVENADARKAKSEQFISKFARVYTPIVCFCGAALAVFPPLIRLLCGLLPQFDVWLYRALTFLVISCPCALVISIPLSFFAAIGGASRRGILMKGAHFVEALAQTKTVLLDKTGTLTKGTFVLKEIFCYTGEREDMLYYAAMAESSSSHPIARSIVAAYGKELDRSRITEAQEVGGEGVRARVDGKEVAVGNDKWMRRFSVACQPYDGVGSVVHIAAEGVYLGYLVIADVLHERAKEAVAALRALGLTDIVMLTGDQKRAAEEVAALLDITDCRSELLPDDKVREVEKCFAEKKAGEKLVFVGDGINDAPVLTRADVGIAMGGIGSDAAVEAADVVLMDDDPTKIALAIRMARKCMVIVRQNIVISLGVKLLCLALGALGFADMWLAVFADVGVMMLAVLNAARCLRG